MTSFSHDMMTRGRGGVWIPPKSDDVIYEQPLNQNALLEMVPKQMGCLPPIKKRAMSERMIFFRRTSLIQGRVVLSPILGFWVNLEFLVISVDISFLVLWVF